jgi:hypothetical protein
MTHGMYPRFYLIPLGHSPYALANMVEHCTEHALTTETAAALADRFVRCLAVAQALVAYTLALFGKPSTN